MESDIGTCPVSIEFDVQRRSMRGEVQRAVLSRGAVHGSGDVIRLEQIANFDVGDTQELGVPGGHAGWVSKVGALQLVGCPIFEDAVVVELLGWVLVMHVFAV